MLLDIDGATLKPYCAEALAPQPRSIRHERLRVSMGTF